VIPAAEVIDHRCAIGEEFTVPDVGHEVMAFRSWNVLEDGHLLSLNGARWRPGGWFVAECAPLGMLAKVIKGAKPGIGHNVTNIPVEGCSCGIYAAKSREHLADMAYNRYSDYNGEVRVVGDVGLAGKIIPGSQGYRALKARPVKIYVPYENWKYVDRIEKLYGIEVVLDNTLR
jgi:hypothetical protein